MRYFSIQLLSKVVFMLCLSFLSAQKLSAQATGHGHEVARGSVDFSALAAYELLHPPAPVIHDVENEDDDGMPVRPPMTDTSRVRSRAIPMHTPYSPAPLLPVSPAPTDTFQTTAFDGWIPPDSHGGVDSNYCITAINGTVRIQTRAGGAVSNVTLNSFFSSVYTAGTGNTFDPRVHYDPYTNRWILVCVADANLATSCILIAVSKTSNPTAGWWEYKILADGTGVNWLDFPNVGYNQRWITITGNFFSISGGSYAGAEIFAFNKANILSGVSAPYTSFHHASSGTLAPALTYDATEPSHFVVETWNGGAGQMQLWKITGAIGSETMTSVAFPTTTLLWQGQSFEAAGPTAGADFAPQLGTSNLLQTNDDRVTQMIFINSKLWFSHNVFLPYSATVNPTHSAIQWWQIDTLGTPVQVGRIEDISAANFYSFSSIAVNATDDALIGFSAFSATTYPATAYALRIHTDPTDSVRPLQIYRHGLANYYRLSGTRNRFGDYSGTAVDPVNMTDFYTIQETTTNTTNNWDTWWAHVKICSPPPAITGTMTVCVGQITTLSDATGGGTWTSSNAGVATVGSGSGDVGGVAAGTTVITYTVNGGCIAVTTVNVNPLPAAITGSANVCVGSTTTLVDAGGLWSSSNTAVATVVAGTGVVSGVTVGTTIISYTLGTGCYVTTTVTANTSPGAITGTLTVCTGSTTNLSDAPGSGAWSSSAVGIATVGPTGIVTGVSAGTSTITYSLGAGCTATAVVTVNTTPSAIGGTLSVCTGLTTGLTDAPGGGAWASSNTAVATVIAGTGAVGGVSAGTVTITYTLSGCRATATVTVNQTPTAITGSTTVCTGSTGSLGDAFPGGAWTSSNTGVATVVGGTGVVSGVTAGTSTIVYTLAGCTNSTTLTVNLTPVAIGGSPALCTGLTTSLTDATPGGGWSSSNTATATVAAGTVGGVAAGTAVISYTLAGCSATMAVTVSVPPGVITGTTTICSGSVSTLSNAMPGGAWSSTVPAVATVVAGTGDVTGVTVGTSTIIYTLGAGCTASTTVNIILGAAAITGTTSACIGGTTSLSDGTSGGGWTSSNTAVATVVAGTGLVGGVSTGTSTITYLLGSGCSAITVVTVSPAVAAPITGSAPVCVGQTVPLFDGTPGGTWSSSNPAIATVGSGSGIVGGVSAGTATITYTVTNSCGIAVTSTVITVNPLPVVAAIGGTLTVCSGATTTLSDATPSGVWSSGATGIATLSGTGVAGGVSAGFAPVSYTVTSGAGCVSSAITVLTVTTPLMPSVSPSGPITFCTGASTVLNATTGAGYTYQWMNGAAIIAGATSSSLTVTTAMGSGNYSVVLNSGSGCIAGSSSVSITVSPSPVVTPAVSVTASPGTSLCAVSSPVTFSPIPTNGGATPSYQWFVNGTATSVGGGYTYSPANGDVVKCILTSSDVCAYPVDTASATATMTITPPQTPAVSISAAPGDTVCFGRTIALTPVPVFGGSAPTYSWTKNSVPSGSASVYSYVPVSGDIVVCTMTSNYYCVSSATATSAPLMIHVSPLNLNAVIISVTSTSIIAGQADTFVAAAPYGGASPAYQWYINLIPVSGATSGIFITSALAMGDLVTCQLTTSDPCTSPKSVSSNGIKMNVATNGLKTVGRPGGFTLIPNPNGGTFTIKGTVKNGADQPLTITVTNMLGQTIYTGSALPHGGVVEEQFTLDKAVASGVYLVSITSSEDQVVFSMVVNK